MKKNLKYILTLSVIVMLGISAVYALDAPATAMLAASNNFTNTTVQVKEFVYDVENQEVLSQATSIGWERGYLFNPFADLAQDPDSNLHRAVIAAYYGNLIMHHLGVGESGGAIYYQGEYYDTSRIYVPCFKNNGSDVTYLDIMNIGGAPSSFSVEFVDAAGQEIATYQSIEDLQPGEAVRPEGAALFGADVTGAVISSTEPLIATVEVSGPNRSMVYSAGGIRDAFLFAPKLDDGQDDGWLSTIWAQNASNVDQEIQVDFYNESGTLIQSDSAVISPSGVFKAATPEGADCAYIDGSKWIAAAVVGEEAGSLYAYRARGAANSPMVPLAMKDAGGWNTSITIQNPSSVDCEVYWRYLDQGGNRVGNDSSSVVIAPDGAYTFSLEDDPTLSNNQSFLGAVKIFAYRAKNSVNRKSAASSIYVPVVVTHEKDGKKAAVSIGPHMGDKASKDFNEPLTWGNVYGFPVIYQYAYEVKEEEDAPEFAMGDSFFCFVDSLKN
ncbi:hypothetical protein SAMN02745216_04986 [Desulfatibacillum alkenivorans DSM 16219]|jgi:hypothetical protein|uniref:Uncharacterized protein n=1 Tax=Desulfatibacillum alkenivorans DSM 16219 TaxID=1121393 RepID=A0A1M6ZIU3_9BACT|nr:hypothetical protein [Desulfatibacillum alkenivorans]SHL30392.1 hypothetical protein SAMN02745216_04986 [Desulfatibacillum alkenivorans DSM 16219]